MKIEIDPIYLIRNYQNTNYKPRNDKDYPSIDCSLMTNKLTVTLLVLVLLQQGLGCLQLTVSIEKRRVPLQCRSCCCGYK